MIGFLVHPFLANSKNITLSSAIIPYNIFNSCNNVKSIVVNKYISNLAYVLYGVDNTNLDISFNYTGPIPDGVCYRKSKLKSITVPSSIKSIGKSLKLEPITYGYSGFPSSIRLRLRKYP